MFQGYAPSLMLLALGVFLLAAELLLPTHGLLGVVGVCSAVVGVVVLGMRNAWAAVLITAAMVLATPLVWTLAMKIWPRTPVGRRVMLPPVDTSPPPAPVTVGQTGVAVSALRPMGICEFDGGVRVEASSEHEVVEPGTRVKVVALVNNRPTVRVA